MVRLIKILNPVKAQELMQLGFNYTKEKLENKDIYVFVQTNEILRHIQKSFSVEDFFIDKTMNF